MSESEDGAVEGSTSYSFGPRITALVQRMREKIAPRGKPPAETSKVFSAALRLLEKVVDASVEGKYTIVTRHPDGEIRLHRVNQEDLQEAIELWADRNNPT